MSQSIAPRIISAFPATIVLPSNLVDWNLGNIFSKNLTTNTTFTFSNNYDGRIITIELANITSSALTLTWPSYVLNPYNTLPIGKTVIIKLVKTGDATFSSSTEYTFTPVLGSFLAIGGTVTTSGPYTIHSFTSSGTFTVLSGSRSVDYLLVAGGGGGGYGGVGDGGGGGAGGLLQGSALATTQSYLISVGAGGAQNTQGQNSSALSLTAIGGGYGGSNTAGYPVGGDGGSGGGGSPGPSGLGGLGTSGQGYDGGVSSGDSGGSGGGAGGAGGDGGGSFGGAGVSSSINGTSMVYAKGGNNNSISVYQPNSGNGGAGDFNTAGGPGSSGIVILRYLTVV